eukprot:31057-Pelagococcus_subviridis.AAC.12
MQRRRARQHAVEHLPRPRAIPLPRDRPRRHQHVDRDRERQRRQRGRAPVRLHAEIRRHLWESPRDDGAEPVRVQQVRRDRQRRDLPPRERLPEHDAQRVLPHPAVRPRVAQVIDREERRAQRSHLRGGDERVERKKIAPRVPRVHVPHPPHGDPPEEHEHGEFAEPVVPERVLPGRVRISREARRDEQERERPSAIGDRRRHRDRGQDEARAPRGVHRARRERARLRHARRPDAIVGVRAGEEVARVVHEVRADLHEEVAEERHVGVAPRAGVRGFRPERAADEVRHERGGERLGAERGDVHPRGRGHGRRLAVVWDAATRPPRVAI